MPIQLRILCNSCIHSSSVSFIMKGVTQIFHVPSHWCQKSGTLKQSLVYLVVAFNSMGHYCQSLHVGPVVLPKTLITPINSELKHVDVILPKVRVLVDNC